MTISTSWQLFFWHLLVKLYFFFLSPLIHLYMFVFVCLLILFFTVTFLLAADVNNYSSVLNAFCDFVNILTCFQVPHYTTAEVA